MRTKEAALLTLQHFPSSQYLLSTDQNNVKLVLPPLFCDRDSETEVLKIQLTTKGGSPNLTTLSLLSTDQNNTLERSKYLFFASALL